MKAELMTDATSMLVAGRTSLILTGSRPRRKAAQQSDQPVRWRSVCSTSGIEAHVAMPLARQNEVDPAVFQG